MKLLERTKLGDMTLKNRMALSAMTRSRAGVDGIINASAVEYYSQRATAGLLITEAINISPQALGSPFTPGIYTQAQTGAWKKVTQAVHEHGSVIYAQLWHTGRAGHSVDKNGELPVAPSAVAIEGAQHFTSEGLKDYEVPHALTLEEIEQIKKDYVRAASNAMEAGFDGVQLHGANGYLPMQFLAESSNHRTDPFGGSIENNGRFLLEVMGSLIDVVGGGQVAIKLSPLNPYNGISFDDPLATYTYLMGELNKMELAFVELSRKNPALPLLPHYPTGDEFELFGKLSTHTLMANTAYTGEGAEAELERGLAQLISFGVPYLANPDLPKRFELGAELNQADRATMFGGGDKGYIDYPLLS